MLDSFALTGGLRLDHHEEYGYHLSPRIYGVWDATDTLTIKGGISTGFHAPDIRSIAPGYAYTTGGGCCSYGPAGTCGVIIADPNLKAESSTSYEIGAVWDNGDVILGGTYFYTDFKDKISNSLVLDAAGNPVRWSEDRNYRLWYNYNIDDAVIQGVELTVTWNATADLTLRGSYTYTQSEQKTGTYAGFPLARTPEHMANLRADWFTPVEGLEAWASINYHGEEIAAGAHRHQRQAGDDQRPAGAEIRRLCHRRHRHEIRARRRPDAECGRLQLLDKEVEQTDFNTVMEGRRWATF